MKVLFIDDDEFVRQLVQLTMVAAGVDLRCASDGHAGVAMAKTDPPDVILLDVIMPGLTGMQTMLRLRSLSQLDDVPIVIVTAMAGAYQQDLYLGAGAAAVIAKPFDTPSLPEQVLTILLDTKLSA